MKKLFLLLFAAATMISCADSKEFKKNDGTAFTAKPYGWMNTSEKIEGVEYDICIGNVVWSALLFESIVPPLLFTGLALYEPVKYVEPEQESTTK